MTLHYAQVTKDTSLLRQNYNLLKQWTEYLIGNSLIPATQLSTDDFEGSLANQTNLAIKGIIGIRAMGRIADILDKRDDAANYSSIAARYVPKMLQYSIANTSDHLTLSYGQNDSWGLKYNLFADKFLKLNVFNFSIYAMETNWYQRHAMDEFGVALDTRRIDWTKSDWQIWASAIVTDSNVRNMFISKVAKFASGGQSTVPFSDWYNTQTGVDSLFKNRPVVGGHFAHLILT